MNAHFPDAETLRSALSLANRAPSVHNSQPWQWRVGHESVHLYANPDLLLPHTDPDARDLMLSCGAALHHCVVALAALGWQAKIHRFPNPAEPDHLAALELRRYPAADLDVTLAAAIPRRRTDRRYYSSWPVPQGDVALMGARAARAGVALRRVDDLAGLKRLVSAAAFQHRTDAGYLTELAAWSGRYAATAGVPARSVPAETAGAVSARAFAGGVLPQTPDTAADQDNAVVLALGTAGDDRLSWLRAGRRRASCCSPRPRWAWRVARSPSLWRSPRRVRRCAATCSAPTDTRRCCCGWVGRRSTPTRCLPLLAATSPKSL
ncbi:nitroreductase family protein [Mycolicibacterium gilvum]|uniref:Nitroreductase family protein n=1 Tax=Mycolicibacterium gilvum TaxID=1804 RepID=A0A379MMU2_9MYCO|nr:nitroreductase family protein [Mycolicibacterium gilvum]